MKIVNPVAVIGENAAVQLLQGKGYSIIDRNFRLRYGEIDIIAVKDETVIFVEVKTRRTSQYGAPLEAITFRKIQELVKTAELYIAIHPRLPKSMRIDAVSIYLNSENKISRMDHVENITL